MFNKKIFISIAIALIVTTTFSCRKIREDNLVKGLWQIQSLKIDTNSINNRSNAAVRALIDTAYANGGNFMHSLLPNYTANKPNAYYRIKYDRDDIVFSYYNINETNVYTVLGKWDLLEADVMYQKTDDFIDGFFDVKNKSTNEYEFSSSSNYISKWNDTVSMIIKIKRV